MRDVGKAGTYALSVVYKGKPTHHTIVLDTDEGIFKVNGKSFGEHDSLTSLIEAISSPVEGWPVALASPIFAPPDGAPPAPAASPEPHDDSLYGDIGVASKSDQFTEAAFLAAEANPLPDLDTSGTLNAPTLTRPKGPAKKLPSRPSRSSVGADVPEDAPEEPGVSMLEKDGSNLPTAAAAAPEGMSAAVLNAGALAPAVEANEGLAQTAAAAPEEVSAAVLDAGVLAPAAAANEGAAATDGGRAESAATAPEESNAINVPAPTIPLMEPQENAAAPATALEPQVQMRPKKMFNGEGPSPLKRRSSVTDTDGMMLAALQRQGSLKEASQLRRSQEQKTFTAQQTFQKHNQHLQQQQFQVVQEANRKQMAEDNALRIAKNRRAARERWQDVLLPMPWDVAA